MNSRRQVTLWSCRNVTVTTILLLVVCAWFSFNRHSVPGLSSAVERVRLAPQLTASTSNDPSTMALLDPAACTLHTCVDVYKCGRGDGLEVRVYVYPETEYQDDGNSKVSSAAIPTPPWSREFADIRAAILDSGYSTSDPHQACFFLPPIDLLNERNVNPITANRMLRSLK